MYDYDNAHFMKLEDNDLFFSRMLFEASKVLNSIVTSQEAITSSNDAGALVLALEYADYPLFSRMLETTGTELDSAAIPQARAILGRYFGSLDEDSLKQAFGTLEFEYADSFLSGMMRFGALKNFTPNVLSRCVFQDGRFLKLILERSKWVAHLDIHLKEMLLSNPHNAELIIQNEVGVLSPAVHWPNALSAVEKRDLVLDYFNGPNPDPNMAGLTIASQETPVLDPLVRVSAERAHKRLTEAFFAKEKGIRTGISVEFKPSLGELVKASSTQDDDGLAFTYTFSLDYFQSLQGYREVFASLATLFNYISPNGLLTMPAKQSDDGIAEKIFGLRAPKHYPTNTTFDFQFQLAVLLTGAYEEHFGKDALGIEGLIEWFFGSHLTEEFSLPKIHFHQSTSASSYVEKIRNFFPELEAALKQFSVYTTYGSLDLDLVRAHRDSVLYQEVPSLVDKKYAYLNDRELENIAAALFSPQVYFFFHETEQRTVGEVLLSEGYCDISEWNERSEGAWTELEKFGLIQIHEGTAKAANRDLLGILRNWQEDEVIAARYLSSSAFSLVSELVEKGQACFEDKLLTRSEAKLFNYLLNRSVFQNGPNLRNRYAHGSNVGTEDAFGMYHVTLLVGMLLVLKVEDDVYLSTRYPRS